MQHASTALVPYQTQRLRPAPTAAHSHAASAISAFSWLTDLAGEISGSASPSLMFVQGEAVVVDTADYELPKGTEAVVVNHDGSLGVERVEHDPGSHSGERRGWGEYRQHPEISTARMRPGVTILGRVLVRAGRQLRAA